jgi:hypothetical protein
MTVWSLSFGEQTLSSTVPEGSALGIPTPVGYATSAEVQALSLDLDDIKGTGFTKDTHSLTNIKRKAALAAALSA